MVDLGAQYLTGEDLEVVWAELSTLSQAVSLNNTKNALNSIGHF